MPDLVGAFERVRRVYRWYIESAFPLRSDALSRSAKRCSTASARATRPAHWRNLPSLSQSPFISAVSTTCKKPACGCPRSTRICGTLLGNSCP